MLLRQLIAATVLAITAIKATGEGGSLEQVFEQPPQEARPWVFWYWLGGAVAAEGITADLEAMAANGIGGAYLMPLIEPGDDPMLDPPIDTLSGEFWDLVRHAAHEADRLGIELGMHAAAGFSLAGGPWIEPAQSMQQLVWTRKQVAGGDDAGELGEPERVADHYRDIAVLAFPTPSGEREVLPMPEIRSSFGGDLDRLADPANEEALRAEEAGWIDFDYGEPVTLRSLRIRPQGNNYQSLRLTVEASVQGGDGRTFRPVRKLVPPRHGWLAEGIPVSYSLPPTTARVFRFAWDPAGSEPGAEDLDWAKWKAVLKLRSLEPGSAARIEGHEGKSGRIWRVSPATEEAWVGDQAIDPELVLDLSDKLDADGRLDWTAPAGHWTILRFGHTSTGKTNYLGAAAMGLECDKLSREAVSLQFDRWFGEAQRQIGPELAKRVLKVFHTDSWECGSQNWTPGMRAQFAALNGYDLTRWLPALAGYPVADAAESERVLRDFRETIGRLLAENFFGTLRERTQSQGLAFSAESIAPVMLGDGLRHHNFVDIPMGEFWLRSPTHDKPTDLLEAVSGARIYGKRIVQAEAFTELRMQWDEHPAMLKPLGDLHYALGINRFSYHVFMHTPWADRRPGVALNGVGLFFQRGQTWWKPGKAWVDYAARCQALLQQGRPVVDLAVFSGAEMPRRALTPDRLVEVLPGLMGREVVERDRDRLANVGQKRREEPPGVRASAGITGARDWIDPLRGYQYDSINLHSLLGRGRVENKRLVLAGGASYAALVIPGPRRMDPTGLVPEELRDRLDQWREQGLPVIEGRHEGDDLTGFGIAPDFIAHEAPGGDRAEGIAWTHRSTTGGELYFISNQQDRHRDLRVSLRAEAAAVELWDAVNGRREQAASFKSANGRSELPLPLPPHGSIFLLLRPPGSASPLADSTLSPENAPRLVPVQRLARDWSVRFPDREEPVDYPRALASWTGHDDPAVRHFSGTARYTREFDWEPAAATGRVFLDLGKVGQIAEVRLNGEPLGTVWAKPCRLDVSGRLEPGTNRLEVEVTNTWLNQLVADAALPAEDRRTWTNAPYPAADRPLPESGLLGPVVLLAEVPDHLPSLPVLPVPGKIVEEKREVSREVMERIHDEVRTPHKFGVVLKGREGEKLDCPNVFRHGDKWYMVFIGITDEVGYRTYLAESDDLLHWKRLGCILDFADAGWDRRQAAAGLAFADTRWGGPGTLGAHEGSHWLSYIGGAQAGYETDPLSIGLASTEDPVDVAPWQRFDANPVLSPGQPHTRPFEAQTLYKSFIMRDPAASLGWPFLMFYNGKEEGGGGIEAIGLAVSRDMKRWQRMGEDWLVHNKGELPWAITGDPQIVRMDDVWVMFHFGAFWKPKAFNTFAASHDLVHWTKWDGPHLVEPSESWDRDFAHKPWVLKHDGVVHHYYCAVGGQGRVIALATSKDLTGTGK